MKMRGRHRLGRELDQTCAKYDRTRFKEGVKVA